MSRNEVRQTSAGAIGSDNVFADLGLPDAENRLLKSRLVGKIDEVIEKRGLTQAEAGRIMGLPQPKVSELRNGRTADYSLERLYRLLNNLGVGVSVVLEEPPEWTRGEVAVRERTRFRARAVPLDGDVRLSSYPSNQRAAELDHAGEHRRQPMLGAAAISELRQLAREPTLKSDSRNIEEGRLKIFWSILNAGLPRYRRSSSTRDIRN